MRQATHAARARYTNAQNNNRWRRLTLTISESEYKTLSDIAKAFNRVSWCEGGNTAASVFCSFVLPEIDREKLVDTILSGIATGAGGLKAPLSVHSARIAELRAALAAVGEV